VAAYGDKDSHTVLSFWSVSTVVNPKQPLEFEVLVSLCEAIDVGTHGPVMTIFCNQDIMSHWRRPRQVHLKDGHIVTGNEIVSTHTSDHRVTTISLPAPLVSIRFMMTGSTSHMALLDWNGGVTLMNCTLLERVASHQLSKEEYNLVYRNDESDVAVPFIETIADRLQMASLLRSPQGAPWKVTTIELLNMESASTMSGTKAALHVALLTEDPTQLYIVSAADLSQQRPPFRLALGSGRGILSACGREQPVSMAFYNDKTLLYGCLQKQKPVDIIETLYQDAKYEDAIAAAENLSATEQKAVSSTIEKCRKDLWRKSSLIDDLLAVSDDSFVIDEALTIDSRFNAISSTTDISLFRLLHQVALQRLSMTRLSTALSMGGLEGTKDFEIRLKERLIRYGTYFLISRTLNVEVSWLGLYQFLSSSLLDIATSLATNADLASLSVLAFRHPHNVMQSFDVVNRIPPYVSPFNYSHLIPVAKEDTSDSQAFLTSNGCFKWADMPMYLKETFNVVVTLDEEDEQLILQCNASLRSSSVDATVFRNWISSQLHRIHQYSADVDYSLQLYILLIEFEKSAGYMEEAGRTLKAAELIHACWMIMLEFHHATDDSSLIRKSVDVMGGLSVIDVIAQVFSNDYDASQIHLRYQKYLAPLVEKGETEESLDAALVFFCMDLLHQGSEGSSSQIDVFTALEFVAAVAKLSNTSISKHDRIIKNF
jgi:hypothetical protein